MFAHGGPGIGSPGLYEQLMITQQLKQFISAKLYLLQHNCRLDLIIQFLAPQPCEYLPLLVYKGNNFFFYT